MSTPDWKAMGDPLNDRLPPGRDVCNQRLVLRCEHCGTVHEDTAKHKEIQEVTEQITCGHPTCGATWRDTEATGWLWFCSLPHGHGGHHRCIGASW